MSNTQDFTVLVVDDDAMNREVMEAFLMAENFTVLLANNGTSALQIADNKSPDVIILDVKMPDLSGYEVCERLKSNPQTKAIPVIIVTGFDAPEDRERGLLAGAQSFLSRPFSGDNLVGHVRDLLTQTH